MLQNRVNELNSGILNIIDNKIHITGFTREEMLQSHLKKGIENWSLKGLYDWQEIEFHQIKDHALIIVQKDGKEIDRHQYRPIYKEKVEWKNEKGKKMSRTFVIRKSTYSEHYHFRFVIDKESDPGDVKDQSMLFSNKEALDQYVWNQYGVSISYEKEKSNCSEDKRWIT
ncbi:MAG: hypothetical protein ACI35O_03485 [Bacillaceae bacterium]